MLLTWIPLHPTHPTNTSQDSRRSIETQIKIKSVDKIVLEQETCHDRGLICFRFGTIRAVV